MPAEWAQHDACWLAFPYISDEWSGHLAQAQSDIAMFARALVAAGERVELLVRNDGVQAIARANIGDLPNLRYHQLPYGDCWVRDTGCIFVEEVTHQGGHSSASELAARSFVFDGWGGKYDMLGDPEVSTHMAHQAGVQCDRASFVLEGGAIETDGLGTFLVTQCVVDRNPEWSRDTARGWLQESLGAKVCHFIDGVLRNDHTDGHIDTLARFVAPGRVVCMAPKGKDDPNYDALTAVIQSLEGKRDSRDELLEVVTIPSPGAVMIDDFLTPATYCNFYIANDAVLVPAYGVPGDEVARAALEPFFPERDVVLVPARGLIVGGGALHCASQQQPSKRTVRTQKESA
jgi:agmatine deiminase